MEYQKQLETRNSSYKLDEKSAQFYEELRHKEQQKENDRKKEEREEVERFKSLKLKKQEGESAKGPISTKVDIARRIAVKKRKIGPRDNKKNDNSDNKKDDDSADNDALKGNTNDIKDADDSGDKRISEAEEPTGTVPRGLVSGYSSSDED